MKGGFYDPQIFESHEQPENTEKYFIIEFSAHSRYIMAENQQQSIVENQPETTPEKIEQIRSILRRSISDGGAISRYQSGKVGNLLPRRLSFSDSSDFSDHDSSEFPLCDCLTQMKKDYTKLNTTPTNSEYETDSGRILS